MILTLKPPGRGNWRPMTLIVDDHKRMPPLLVRPGQRVFLGGIDWRICLIDHNGAPAADHAGIPRSTTT